MLRSMFAVSVVVTGMLMPGCQSETAQERQLAEASSPAMPSKPIRVVFLTRDGCLNTPVLLDHLKSAAQLFDLDVEYEIIDQGTLVSTDPRSGYPTPTILYEDRDLFGLPRPSPPFPAPS